MKTILTRKVLLSLAAVSAVMVATPALAQNYEAQRYGYGENHPYDVWGRDIDQRQARLEQRASTLASNGQISRGEYRRLDLAFDQFDRIQGSYRRGGLTRAEVNDLNRRLEGLQAQIRYERRDDRRDDRWDRDDRGDDRRDRDGRGRRDRDDD